MKKTFSINIGGFVFNIDEDAYELLKTYLDSLRNAFGEDQGCDDIVSDIESRICEILIEKTFGTQRVVDIHTIEDIISMIGNAQEIGGVEITDKNKNESELSDKNNEASEASESSASSASTVPPYNPNLKTKTGKRLYRDPKDHILGGVCSGIAQYIGSDPTWVRLIGVALCFVSLTVMCVVYIILWIVLPEATTVNQRMEMIGETPTIQNIGESVKKDFASNTPPVFPNYQNINTKSTRRKIADGIIKTFAIIANVFLVLFGIISLPILIVCTLGIIGCIIGILVYSSVTLGLWETSIHLPNGIWTSLLLGISTAILIGIPTFALIYRISQSYLKLNPINNILKVILIVLWVVSLIATPLILIGGASLIDIV